MDTDVSIKQKDGGVEMERIPGGRYTKGFGEEAVRMATEGGLKSSGVARQLLISRNTLGNWLRAKKSGNLGEIGKGRRAMSELESELTAVKRELALTKMERDILKKAAAYFAKESL